MRDSGLKHKKKYLSTLIRTHAPTKTIDSIIVHNTYWESSAFDQSASRSLTVVRDFNYLYYPALIQIQVYMYFTVGYI